MHAQRRIVVDHETHSEKTRTGLKSSLLRSHGVHHLSQWEISSPARFVCVHPYSSESDAVLAPSGLLVRPRTLPIPIRSLTALPPYLQHMTCGGMPPDALLAGQSSERPLPAALGPPPGEFFDACWIDLNAAFCSQQCRAEQSMAATESRSNDELDVY